MSQASIVFDIVLVVFNRAFQRILCDGEVLLIFAGVAKVKHQLSVPGIEQQSFFDSSLDPFPVLLHSTFFDTTADTQQSHSGHFRAGAVIVVALANTAVLVLTIHQPLGHERSSVSEGFNGIVPVLMAHGFSAFFEPVLSPFFTFVHRSDAFMETVNVSIVLGPAQK